ncbi:Ubiquitin carboxyl-terminal hydrolase 7 [Nakaseomyces glabratus]|uniref:ubiquitinyl hydrolase 1 n=1 Tax=Candida glabrata TaxID=5478 RepID=A0A0W0D956_CANGB|nr:Ubiquitin carboxyl-terminal hydrolase 7 [Nakaseomyces glabratus]KTB06131.1 Ubiquitin carboxyl-terminal hydrolase 7 [Nakaseomyces glabratus]KTB08254.1 Ubiquitin carboxyl-terminal hydrolase 7 [Nakaseomyces glabratus]KTB20709.1 Ubiquitin carboxyl-terminal hydrolase 7 [Nakaseomyces glabratus]
MDRFTPEFSGQLLLQIQQIYVDEIRPQFPQLKLQRLLDLLEQAQCMLEDYMGCVDVDTSKAVRVFITGCFYIYLVMPESMQFQTRSKSYSLYTELRHLYESQLNMTNVIAMVKEEVAQIQEQCDNFQDNEGVDDSKPLGNNIKGADNMLNQGKRLITRRSAYSISSPSGMSTLSLHDELPEHRSEQQTRFPSVERDQSNGMKADMLLDKKQSRTKSNPITNINQPRKSLDVTLNANNEIPTLSLHSDDKAVFDQHNEAKSLPGTATDSDEEYYVEHGSPIWTAPDLDPNDQLKLALGTELLSPPVMGLDGDTLGDDIYYETVSKGDDVSYRGKDFEDLHANRLITHRKDSYHSIYMIDDDNNNSKNYFDGSNAFIQGLERLQKQSIITAPELFSILSNPEERHKLLLIDLRLNKRSMANHIVAPNVVNIDPTNLWDNEANSPIYKDTILEQRLNNPLFNGRLKYDYIVYYSDMKTYMNFEYDYSFILFYLLTTSGKHLSSVPTALLGGYEKWKKVMNTYVSQYQIELDDYLYRPYAPSNNKGEQNNAQIPDVPTWKPPPVPVMVRKRPPPPVPVSIPIPPETPPPLPQKIKLESIEESAPSDNSRYIRPPAKLPIHALHSPRNQTLTRKFSIPTIEKNSNPYVAYSVTGLRNLGNTCYINCMLQSLFATNELKNLFISGKYREYQMKPNDNKESAISNTFANLFNKMYMNGGCTVVPSGFLKICNFLRPDLRIPDDQQDTQEFLLFILNRLHDELSNQVNVINDYPNLLLYDDDKMMVDKEKYKKWFDKTVVANGLSPVDGVFQGQMENALQCQRCGYESVNYSTFYVLSLALPKPSAPAFYKSGRVKLEDCINMFTSDEVLTGENAWDCPKCGSKAVEPRFTSRTSTQTILPNSPHHHKKSKFFGLPTGKAISRSKSPFRKLGLLEKHEGKQEKLDKMERDEIEEWHKMKSKKLVTIKTINFISLPKVLIIHLSRFYYDLTKKNDAVVSYPLVLNIVLKNEEIVRYKLYSIVNHTGNLISGHYTSLVNKDPHHNLGNTEQKWYYFDDEVVKAEKTHGNVDKGITKVSSKNVYVLFYERVD